MANVLLGCCFLYILGCFLSYSAAITLETSLKMAQCRAHCLNKFGDVNPTVQENKMCKENSDCFRCWQTCEKLSTDFPIWSYNCGQETRCDKGCQAACDFLSSHRNVVVPLSPYKSRLTLIFGGTSAQWSLVWGPDVPEQKAVFALFTRSSGKPWKLRVQTSNFGASLKDVSSGTELKLVAVAESGLLSVIITPFDPPGQRRGLAEEEFPWNKDNAVEGDEDQGWPLHYEAAVQPSGLVAAKVWWSTQRPVGSNFLVTWEVSGGGLKGHLYTDLPEVDLTLWPETVYKVQVEVVTGPLGEPRTSQLLILDTHNITFEAQSAVRRPLWPVFKRFDSNVRVEIIVGAALGIMAALTVICALIYRRKCTRQPSFDDSSSSNSKLTLNRSVVDLTFEETLMKQKGSLLFPSPELPLKQHQRYAVPSPPKTMEPQNTLGIPTFIQTNNNILQSTAQRRPPHVSVI